MPPHLPRRRILVVLALAAWAGGARAAANPGTVEVGGVAFERRASVAGQELRLNGAGLRAVAWFKGYAAALYLTQAARSAAQVISAPGAKRLRMRMMVDVSTEEFIKAVHKGVERNLAAEQRSALVGRIAEFDQVLRRIGGVKDGDVIDLDFVPGRGFALAINGRPRSAPIPGEDFYAALMLVFVGERPVDEQLKRQLLAGARA